MHIADFSVGMLGANGVVGGGFGIATGAALGLAAAGLGRASSPASSATARSTRAPSSRTRTTPRSTACRSSTCARTTGSRCRCARRARPRWGGSPTARWRSASRAWTSTAWTSSPPGRSWPRPSSAPAPATGRRSSSPPATGSAATTSATRRTTAARTRQPTGTPATRWRRSGARLVAAGILTDTDADAIVAEEAGRVAGVGRGRRSRAAARPGRGVDRHPWLTRLPHGDQSAAAAETGAERELTYAAALNEALREEMERDPAVFCIGEDIAVLGRRRRLRRDPRAGRDVRAGAGPRHAGVGGGDRRARASAPRWSACARSPRSCTRTS